MSASRTKLIELIKYYKLDFRFSHWHEHLFMAEQGLYPDSFCEILLDDARADGEKIEKTGYWPDQPPLTVNELYPNGKPDIEIGSTVETNLRFGIRFKDRPRNILMSGGSGSGKTICSYNIITNVDKVNQTQPDNPTLFVIIDIKPSYLELIDMLSSPVVALSAINNAKIGLNGPENIAPYIWIGQISLSIAGRLKLISSRTGLTSIIAALLLIMNPGLKEQDLKDPSVSKHLTYPPLGIVLKAIRHNKKIADAFFSKATYTQSLIGALEGLLQDSGDLFDCCNGLDVNDIIRQKKHLIFNVSTFLDYVTHIVTDLCINQVMIKRMAENYKTNHTDLIYLLDECDLLLESDVSNFPGMSPLDRLHRFGREMGLMSCVCVSGL
jgi:hypothetical protein